MRRRTWADRGEDLIRASRERVTRVEELVRLGVPERTVAEFQADVFWQAHRRLPEIEWNVPVFALDGTLIE